jgi:hypothetical protein
VLSTCCPTTRSQTRTRLLDEAARDGSLVLAYHVAGFGQVERHNGGYRPADRKIDGHGIWRQASFGGGRPWRDGASKIISGLLRMLNRGGHDRRGHTVSSALGSDQPVSSGLPSAHTSAEALIATLTSIPVGCWAPWAGAFGKIRAQDATSTLSGLGSAMAISSSVGAFLKKRRRRMTYDAVGRLVNIRRWSRSGTDNDWL